MRRLCVSVDTICVYFVSVLWPAKKASWQSEDILPVYRHNQRCNWPKGKEVVLKKGFLSGAVLAVLFFLISSGLFLESYESFGAAIRVLLVWNIQSFWILRILILSGNYMHTHTHNNSISSSKNIIMTWNHFLGVLALLNYFSNPNINFVFGLNCDNWCTEDLLFVLKRQAGLYNVTLMYPQREWYRRTDPLTQGNIILNKRIPVRGY